MQQRAQSFGKAANNYSKFRPGPPETYLDWLLPNKAETVLDLGAGTGSLTKTLLRRGHTVISVEPDPRMREVLSLNCAEARVVSGTAENIPIGENSVHAVLVSSAWHWMDSDPATAEIGRVLTSGGTFGIVWTQPDLSVPWIAEFDALVDRTHHAAAHSTTHDLDVAVTDADLARRREALARKHTVRLPPGSPFSDQEEATFTWRTALNSTELLGLVGTSSRVITLPRDQRDRIIRQAALLIEAIPGRSPGGTVDVPMISRCWRSRRTHRSEEIRDRDFGGSS